MRQVSLSKALSRRAPTIVVVTLCASLIGSWIGVPAWIAKMLALIVASLALALMASRRPSHQLTTEEAQSRPSWIAYELAGQGTPAGHYLLAFFSIVTIVLTGFDTSYAMLAWAAFALAIVWGIVNARYPTEAPGD